MNQHLKKKSAEELSKAITTKNLNLGNAILDGLQIYDEKVQGSIGILTKLINSNVSIASVVENLADFVKYKIFSQISLIHIDEKRYKK